MRQNSDSVSVEYKATVRRTAARRYVTVDYMWTMAYSRKDQPIESDLVGKTVSSAQEVRPLYWRV